MLVKFLVKCIYFLFFTIIYLNSITINYSKIKDKVPCGMMLLYYDIKVSIEENLEEVSNRLTEWRLDLEEKELKISRSKNISLYSV